MKQVARNASVRAKTHGLSDRDEEVGDAGEQSRACMEGSQTRASGVSLSWEQSRDMWMEGRACLGGVDRHVQGGTQGRWRGRTCQEGRCEREEGPERTGGTR